MPRLTLIAAQSIDGFITRHDTPGTGFCSEADSQFLSTSLKGFDSLIMGRKTFDTTREFILNSKSTRYLRKIVTRTPEAYQSIAQAERVEFTRASPADILSELDQRDRKNTALLGGSEIYTSFLEANLVDELWLTIEPFLFGSGAQLASRPLDLEFTLHATTPLAPNTLLLKYLPKR